MGAPRLNQGGMAKVPAKKETATEKGLSETIKGFEKRLRRLERAVERLVERMDRLTTRRRKEAARERSLRMRLDGLEARVSRAISSLERKVEGCFKELADSLKVNSFEAQIKGVMERLSEVERKVTTLEGGAPTSRDIPPIPTREVRATRWAVGVRAPGGRWITIPRDRFLRMCEVASNLGAKGPFSAKDLYDRMPELKELKRGMFQTRAAVSAMELMGLIKRVGKGENGVRLYSPSVPVEELVKEAEKKIQRLIALREGREAAGLQG